MNRMGNPQRVEVWRKRLVKQAAGPWSVAEFCRREGVSQPAFYLWRKRLGNSPRPARRETATPRQAPEVEFLSLELPDSLLAAGVRIDLPSGAVVQLPGSASPAIIAAAIQAACGTPATREPKP